MAEPKARLLPLGIALLALACQSSGRPAGYIDVSGAGWGSRDAGVSDASALLDGARGAAPRWPSATDEIVLPYRGGSRTIELVIEAQSATLDVHANVDTTGSIEQEIDTLQTKLRGVIIPRLRARVQDVSFGVSSFADFPVTPFGRVGDKADVAFKLLTPITADVERASLAVAKLDRPLGHGGDGLEAGAEALYQVATGDGYAHDGTTYIEPYPGPLQADAGTLGGVGFRSRALRVVLHVTDTMSHSPRDYAPFLPGTRGIADAAAALSAISAHAIGLLSADCELHVCSGADAAYRELVELAFATSATSLPVRGACPTGHRDAKLAPRDGRCPLAFYVAADGVGLADTVVDAVVTLLDSVSFREVHAEAGEDPLSFVQGIEASRIEAGGTGSAPTIEDRLPAGARDGRDDTFVAVAQGTRLGFRVILQNDRVAPLGVEQRFRLSILILGDGALVSEQVLRVVVPPARAAAPRDAGPAFSPDATVPDDDAGMASGL